MCGVLGTDETMVRVITQETFDDVVKENIEDFDMSPEEALQDAVQQFEAQGVDLDNIIKEVMNKVTESVSQKLSSLLESINNHSLEEDRLTQALNDLQLECDKDLAHKMLAGKMGCYGALLDVLERSDTNIHIAEPVLSVLTSLMTGQPDLLDERGIGQMMRLLGAKQGAGLQAKVLGWARECCLKHEKNRQDLIKHGVVAQLKVLLEQDDVLSPVVRSVCALMRALVLDDDIRVVFGLAHEHARKLAEETLVTLINLTKKFKDKETMSELLMTLSALMVRSEFCQRFQEAGGLKFLMDVLAEFPESERLTRHCLSLIKGLAGDDDVKARMGAAGIAPLIVLAMNNYKQSASLAAAASACMAAITLRSPANSKSLVEAGAAEAILETMKTHQNDVIVQKQCSWAIRNIVSRDRSLNNTFLSLGAEELLQEALKRHGSNCEYDIKSALRDLECEVELIERWTGKGGALN
uniref:Armadillo repeat-containing protein 6 n=1 Tax=Timema genevievae TaxID=629358 RepID=A0A7R9JRQ3_TIMGE|nr:unnamed protein product [Timema genevievae]